jgi:hypothetical protein
MGELYLKTVFKKKKKKRKESTEKSNVETGMPCMGRKQVTLVWQMVLKVVENLSYPSPC